VAKPEDRTPLDADDFRRVRAYLAPHVYYPYEEGASYPPPSDLIDEDVWHSIMDLPTDVVLKTSSDSGSAMERLQGLTNDWTSSWPEVGSGGVYAEETCLLAGEELDALVINAVHGFYRQALGCLRNALEIMSVAAALAATDNPALFGRWRQGQEIGFGQARAWLRDSSGGRMIDGEVDPESIFGDAPSAWVKEWYARLGGYAHSQAGYNNADFWESNGPVYRPRALDVVEAEFRETLALMYLMLRIAWPGYEVGQGEPRLLDGPLGRWAKFDELLRRWLL